jgi:hypothetical protein
MLVVPRVGAYGATPHRKPGFSVADSETDFDSWQEKENLRLSISRDALLYDLSKKHSGV